MTQATAPGWVLNADDRCDRCGAQAHVVSQHGDSFLFWCWHHARENWAKIEKSVIVMEKV